MADSDYLTDEERAALDDEDLDQAVGAEDADGADGAESGPDDDDAGAAEAADGAAGTEADPPDADPAAVADGAGTPSFNVPAGNLEEINQSIGQLRQLKDKLEAAYESGDSELTYAEHRAKLREIDTALLDLNAERAEAQAIQKLNAAYQQEWWQREIRAFKREAAKEGVDYDGDPKLEAAWDKAVRFLGGDPDNAQQDAGWFLREAHEMVKARFKLGRSEPTIPPAEQRLSKVDEALAARRAKAAPPPPSLSKLPQAGLEQEGKGEFSYLDDLSGLALERAVAKLSPEQQARWEAEQ